MPAGSLAPEWEGHWAFLQQWRECSLLALSAKAVPLPPALRAAVFAPLEDVPPAVPGQEQREGRHRARFVKTFGRVLPLSQGKPVPSAESLGFGD